MASIFRLRRAFGAKRFDTGDATWGGGIAACDINKVALGQTLRGLDLQIHVDALVSATWTLQVKCEGSQEFRMYNDNGGTGFDSNGIVLIDSIHVTDLKITLTGGSPVAPAVIVNWNRRGM